ncbi:hypothetical protein [Saccharopolyspora sp. ASAGF58]|uniref:hypothetical protein n=1 Tax=Saccharopolyspora sp. ASAGF58 TaxID=2719023 RepID=UPI0014452A3D|nr:hypothetical protein [Saccharopolyspora sp. ASAGF58]
MSSTTIERPLAGDEPPSPASTRGRARPGLRGRLVSLPLLALVSFLVLVPVGFILLAAWVDEVPRPGNISLSPTLDNFRVLVADGVLKAAGNSILIAVGSTVLALLIGGFLAFVTARTNIPGKPLVFLIGLMPLFLPSYVGALAWSILGSPGAGLINIAFRDMGVTGPVIDAYSLAGVVAVMADVLRAVCLPDDS